MKKVNCIGILVVDALAKPIEKYPVPEERTQVITDSILFLPGGGAANSAAALGQIGINVSVFAKIGQDSNGIFIIQELKKNNVVTDGICISKHDSTPFTFVGIHSNNQRTFIHTPGANKTFCLNDIDQEKLLDCNYLLYQDLWVLPNIDGAPGAELLKKAQRRGIITLVDECWGLGPDRQKWETMVACAQYVLPSLDDMKAIYPDKDRKEIADYLLGLGCEYVILKMGADGCLVCNKDKKEHVPTSAQKIVDTTGAGDCFNAGFIAGLVNGRNPKQAAVIGSKAAAACMKNVGGAVDIPKFEEL
ncbi:MAG: carbohydrate kinase family protein [bacterium]